MTGRDARPRKPRRRPPAGRPGAGPHAGAWLGLLPDAAIVVDPSGRILGANRRFAASLGRPLAACRGLRPGQWLVAADHERLQEALEAARRTPGRPRQPVELRLKAGRSVPRAFSVAFVDQGRYAETGGILGTLRPVAEGTRPASGMADSRLRLDLAQWSSQVGFWEMDVPADDTRWVNNWCEALGIDPCEGAGHEARWDANVHPEDLRAAASAFRDGLAGARDYYEAEYRMRTRRGGWRWIRERGRVVNRSARGEPLRMIGICVDIDELKRAEQEVHELRANLDLAVEAADLPVWVWDVERQDLRVNEPGRVRARLDGRRAPGRSGPGEQRFLRVHPDDVPRMREALADHEAGRKEMFEVEYRRRGPRGTWKWALDRGRIVRRNASGAAHIVRGVTIDIDERRRLEEAIFDAVNTERQRLSRDLHDGLSQELTGARLQLWQVVESLEARGDRLAGRAREAVDILSGAVETSRKLAYGLSPATSGPGGLREALAHLAGRLSRTSGVDVTFSSRGTAPVRIDATRAEHVYRIAQEAASNALKHATPRSVQLELDVDAERIRMRVTDDGTGIRRDRIGKGLGTRIMRSRANAVEGRLSIRRVARRGSRIEFECANRGAS